MTSKQKFEKSVAKEEKWRSVFKETKLEKPKLKIKKIILFMASPDWSGKHFEIESQFFWF